MPNNKAGEPAPLHGRMERRHPPRTRRNCQSGEPLIGGFPPKLKDEHRRCPPSPPAAPPTADIQEGAWDCTSAPPAHAPLGDHAIIVSRTPRRSLSPKTPGVAPVGAGETIEAHSARLAFKNTVQGGDRSERRGRRGRGERQRRGEIQKRNCVGWDILTN